MHSKPTHNRERRPAKNREKATERIDVTLSPEDAELVRRVAKAKRLPATTYARSAIVQQAERDAAAG